MPSGLVSHTGYSVFRYHNGTLLDRALYKYEEDLVLRDLKPKQSGQYYCKASSDTGSIKSSPAFLTVFGRYSYRKSLLDF